MGRIFFLRNVISLFVVAPETFSEKEVNARSRLAPLGISAGVIFVTVPVPPINGGFRSAA